MAGVRAPPPYLPVLMLVWLFGVGLLAYEGESYLGCGSIPGLIRAAHFQAEIFRGFPVLICTAAIVATLLSRYAAVAQGGRRSTPGRLQLCLSGLLLAAGLLAYGLTRGHSYDAQHRLPWPEVPRFYTGRIAVPVTASDAGCAEDPEQLEILLQEQHITLHGSLTAATELPELLERHVRLWRAFHPDKVLDFRPVIVARGDEPVSGRLTAVLQAVSQVKDVAAVELLLQRPAQLRTKTLGPLSYPLRCYRQLTFAPTGRPLSSFAAWGELGRAAPAVGALPVALPRRAAPATGSSSAKSSGG